MEDSQPFKNSIIHAAEYLADRFTQEYPQFNSESNQPNYAFVGSLAATLLAEAAYYEEINGTRIQIPTNANQSLYESLRSISDIDIAMVENNNSFNNSSIKSLENIPEHISRCLSSPNNSYVRAHSIGPAPEKWLAKISINNKEYFIHRPDVLFAQKTFFIISFPQLWSEKLENDFLSLYKVSEQLYDYETLINTTSLVMLSNFDNSSGKAFAEIDNFAKNYDISIIPKSFLNQLSSVIISSAHKTHKSTNYTPPINAAALNEKIIKHIEPSIKEKNR